jgi:hypothetical protein
MLLPSGSVIMATPRIATSRTTTGIEAGVSGAQLEPIAPQILFFADGTETGSTGELFRKMVAAMGIDSGVYSVHPSAEIEAVTAQAPSAMWVGFGAKSSQGKGWALASLEEILQNPGLKKPVWETLKTVLSELARRVSSGQS